jgi:putative oxidoreductase
MEASNRFAAAGALAGRILIVVLFAGSALGKLSNFEAAAGGMAAKGLPFAVFGLGCAIALELACAGAVLVGWRTRWAALALTLFTLVTAVLFHDFWAARSPQEAMTQHFAFFKNIGIAGGLLVLAALGPGPLSLRPGKG